MDNNYIYNLNEEDFEKDFADIKTNQAQSQIQGLTKKESQTFKFIEDNEEGQHENLKIDLNRTNSTCFENEFNDILDESFPDINSINYNNHMNLLIELEDEMKIHLYEIDNNENNENNENKSNCSLSCMNSTNYTAHSKESLSRIFISNILNPSETFEYIDNDYASDGKSILLNNSYISFLDKSLFTNISKNIFDYSSVIIRFFYNKICQRDKNDFLNGILLRHQMNYFFNFNLNLNLKGKSNDNHKINPGNIRKRLKGFFNKKINELMNLLIFIIFNIPDALKEYPNNSQYKKNSFTCFEKKIKDLLGFDVKNRVVILKLIWKMRKMTCKSQRSDENNSYTSSKERHSNNEFIFNSNNKEYTILIDILKALLMSKYGILINQFFQSEVFLKRVKNEEGLNIEKIYDEYASSYYSYMTNTK